MIRKIIDALRKIFQILNRHQKILGVIVLICSFIAAVLETLGVSVIVPLVNALLQPAQLFKNAYIRCVTEFLEIDTNEGLIILIILATVLIYILKNLYFIFFVWIKSKYACKVQRECSVYMMQSYMNRGYSFFLNRNVSEVTHGISGDVASLYQIINSLLLAVTQLLIAVFICAYMCYADWQIAIGVILSASVCLLIIFVFFRKRMLQAGIRLRTYSILASKALLQAFHGIKEVLVMRKQKYFINEYEENIIKRQNATIVQNVGTEIPAYIIEVICITGIMIILGVRIVNISDPQNFVAVLASFAIGAFRILPALGKISVAINTISSSVPGLNAVYENIVEARKYNDRFYNMEIEDEEEYHDLTFAKSVSIRNLSFAYNSQQPRVLNKLSLDIPKGKSVAFVGESGAGKSTLADLILGLLKPDEGEILLDDVDIRKIPSLWAKLIGYVPQSIYLSDTSICKNIAFGVAESEIDENSVKVALEKAELLDFVQSLPNGIHTKVGDRGIRLSGGQRQRIGIARALYHNPEILILDEATSALDSETEKSVMEAIESLQGKATLIIIAHRLSTIKNCDTIYEIVDGRAVKRTYEELV
ncbi:MAG: ABC transporter ATP-binding protein [Lachnospiraceae bacterium]|nr:ABC transporter ATP-binding protein [Lachnospiraceae bacterium]